MKKLLYTAILVTALLLTSCIGRETIPGKPTENEQDRPQMSDSGTVQSLAAYSATLAEFTSERVLGVYADDYNSDGISEAYAITFDGDEAQEPFHSSGVSAWFIKNGNAERIIEGDLAYLPVIYEFEDKKLFAIDDYSSGTASTIVWFVSGNNAFSYGNYCVKLYRSKENANHFYAEKFENDKVYNMGDRSYNGTTTKPYYLYYDGNFFCEYGGSILREHQLRAMTGADEILTAIDEGGYSTDGIFIRENGIININISKNNGDGTVNCENVTLLYEDNAVRLVPKGTPEQPLAEKDNDEAVKQIIAEKFANPEKFSYSGSYSSSLLPHIATYPAGSPNER